MVLNPVFNKNKTMDLADVGFVDSSDEECPEEYERLPLKLDWLDLSPFGSPASVAISKLPGCRFKDTWRNLTHDIDYLQNAGIESVYVLLTKGELKKYRVPQLLQEYEEKGLTVHHCPFPDGTAPNAAELVRILNELLEDIEQNTKCLIHCLGGLGRSCLIASCLLLYLDSTLSPDAVMEKMKTLRGAGAIQTFKQLNFINDFQRLKGEMARPVVRDGGRSLSR